MKGMFSFTIYKFFTCVTTSMGRGGSRKLLYKDENVMPRSTWNTNSGTEN